MFLKHQISILVKIYSKLCFSIFQVLRFVIVTTEVQQMLLYSGYKVFTQFSVGK